MSVGNAISTLYAIIRNSSHAHNIRPAAEISFLKHHPRGGGAGEGVAAEQLPQAFGFIGLFGGEAGN